MSEKVESKKYSWAWLEASRLLSHGPCELVFAYFVMGGATSASVLYDGESTSGDVILKWDASDANPVAFPTPVPVYCRKGLYVSCGDAMTGIFVMWRELGHKEG